MFNGDELKYEDVLDNVNDLFYVELGGSSSQTVFQDREGRFWFSPGVVQTTQEVALACLGLINNGFVYYATNLKWPDIADPKKRTEARH